MTAFWNIVVCSLIEVDRTAVNLHNCHHENLRSHMTLVTI
jgi:hypothetical protein